MRRTILCTALLALACLAALLYSVHGTRQRSPLRLGQPSPQTFTAPVDTQVIDYAERVAREIADRPARLTYVRSAWGNKAAPVAAATVAQIRAATASRKTPWTAAVLAQVIPVKK